MKLAAHYFDAYGEFNPIQYLVEANNTNSVKAIKIDCDFNISSEEILNKLEEDGFKPLITTEFISSKSTKHDYLVNYSGKIIVDLSSLQNYTGEEDSYSDPKIKIFHTGSDQSVQKIKDKLVVYLKIKSTDMSKHISLLCQENNQLQLVDRKMKPIDIDTEDNYELSFPYETLLEKIESDKAGLILLTGKPGTGKSSLIKHFVQIVNKKFIFIPVDMVGMLATPSFIKFAMSKFNDSILIIEDAETCLADRKSTHNSTASTLLNITDGFLGDLIGLKIIATVNTEDNIDQALLRKGRMLAKVDFKELPTDKANRVLSKLNKKSRVEEPAILADLYSMDELNGSEIKEKRAIGF